MAAQPGQHRPVKTAEIAQLNADIERPLGLIVAGGASLGSYQAGFLYYYTQYLLALREFVKVQNVTRNLKLPAPKGVQLVTGASAGSINTFLSVVESCRRRQPRPEESLFYKSWIPVGLETLTADVAVENGALLSRKPIEDAANQVTALWKSPNGWATEPCNAIVGLSVTRLRPREVNILTSGKLSLSRQTEKFAVKLSGEGGKPPRIAVFDPAEGNKDPVVKRLYPLIGAEDEEVSVETVSELLKASASFPVAFSPIRLQYRFFDEQTKGESRRFIDGGVFDNTPIRLAARLHRWSSKREDTPSPLRLLFLESDVIGWERWRSSSDAEGDEEEAGLMTPTARLSAGSSRPLGTPR